MDANVRVNPCKMFSKKRHINYTCVGMPASRVDNQSATISTSVIYSTGFARGLPVQAYQWHLMNTRALMDV